MVTDTINVPADFGIDLGGRYPIEGAVEWAVEHDVKNIDVRLTDRLRPEEYDDDEIARINDLCDDHDISLGLHTLSAVNTAEFTPILRDAIQEYMFSYIDIAAMVNADRTIVHGGYHFTGDVDERTEASLQRLEEMIAHAEEKDVTLLLENMNPEPADAEVHYLCSKLDDVEQYFERLESPNLRWAFNPPHAHLHEEGIDGYIDALDVGICREVRLNDNRGVREEHLVPGEGTIDFENLFARLEESGYEGPYTVAQATLDETFEAIERLVENR